MPAPGCHRLTATSAKTSATRVIASNQMSAFNATRPTRFMSFMEATPCTTVQKITGPMIMRTRLTKASPKGCICAPSSGRA